MKPFFYSLRNKDIHKPVNLLSSILYLKRLMKITPRAHLGLLLVTSCLFQHCAPSEPSTHPTDTCTLASGGIITIPIDSTTINYSVYPTHYANDTAEWYIDGNDYVNGIDVYDLAKAKLVKRIIFPQKGMNGLTFAKKLYVQSLDSIYVYSEGDMVYSAGTPQILLVNYKGDVLKRYPVITRKPRTSWIAHLAAPFTIRDGYAYFAFMVFGDNREQMGHKALVRYNLKTGAYEEYGPAYPEVFRNYIFREFIPAFTFGHHDNILVRFPSLPELYNYDMKTDSTTVIPMKSQYQNKPITPDSTAQGAWELDDDFHDFQQHRYLGVYYSPYDHLYFSVFSEAIPVADSLGNRHDFHDRPLTVIILDETFKRCGEIRLKDYTYFPNFIPTRQGLLIPRSHPKNPENDESNIQFEIFRPASLP
jgi:hypothetical protein